MRLLEEVVIREKENINSLNFKLLSLVIIGIILLNIINDSDSA